MRIILIGLSLLLAGCAGANLQEVNNQMRPKAQAEFTAWANFADLTSAQCAGAKTLDQVKRKEAMSIYKCADSLIQKTIVPVALYPDLLTAYRLKRVQSYRAYAIGQVEQSEFLLLVENDWNQYVTTIDGRVRQAQMQAQQKDMVQSQQMMALGTSLMTQPNTQKSEAMEYTDCYRVAGGNIQCRSY